MMNCLVISCVAFFTLLNLQVDLISCRTIISNTTEWHFISVTPTEQTTEPAVTSSQLVFARNSLDCAITCKEEYENGRLCAGFVFWDKPLADRSCQLVPAYPYVSKYAAKGQAYYLQEAIGECPIDKGYNIVKGDLGGTYCLRVTEKPFGNYDEGKALCEADGAFPFHLDGASDRIATAMNVRKSYKGLGDRFFIGLTDREKEGEWVWDHSGKKEGAIRRFRWYGWEPDNNGGNQNCVALLFPSGLLADHECLRNYPIMCEIQMNF